MYGSFIPVTQNAQFKSLTAALTREYILDTQIIVNSNLNARVKRRIELHKMYTQAIHKLHIIYERKILLRERREREIVARANKISCIVLLSKLKLK